MLEPPIKPPRAAKRPHTVRSPHGDRDDSYYWLRDDERRNPDVLAYLAAENSYHALHRTPVKALEDKVYVEILDRLKQDDSTVPYRKNGYWYYTRFETGQEHPIYARRRGSLDAPEEIILDANEESRGHEYYQIGELDVSPNGECLAFCEDTIGRRQYTLRFKDLRSGEMLPESIRDVEADMAWANDNRTLFYVEKDPETLLGLYVKRHRLGTDHGEDPLVFAQTDTTLYTGISKSKSERFIFLSMEGTLTSEWRYANADDPEFAFTVFSPREANHEYQIEHLDDRFIVRTNWQAQNFRLMQVPVGREHSRSAWQDMVAAREDTFIEDFDVFRHYLAISVRSAGLRKISIKPLQPPDAAEFFISSDEAAYTTAIATNPELDSQTVRYAYSSLATPTTIYDFNMRTGAKTLLKRDPVLGGFDSANYRTEFMFAPSRDGMQIPVSLIYHKNFVRNGSAPLLQYAYGAYGLSMDTWFSSARFSLIDRGFVYAIAHIRGGQELGRAWYDGGRLLQKKNSFEDFIAVTRFLAAENYVDKDKICAMGGSAGGLLMGAVANMSPQDYRAIVAQVPFVDVVTTMLDDTIPLTTNEYDEWGNPIERAAYDYMLSYSPYDNVRAQAYPAMLITTGLWDSQVQYYEPAKWVAKLRASKTDDNVLLLHTDMEAGHGGKSGRFQRYREAAMEYAFILDQVGIET